MERVRVETMGRVKMGRGRVERRRVGRETGFHTEGGHPGISPPPLVHGKYSYINVNSVNTNIYMWHRRKCYAIPIQRQNFVMCPPPQRKILYEPLGKGVWRTPAVPLSHPNHRYPCLPFPPRLPNLIGCYASPGSECSLYCGNSASPSGSLQMKPPHWGGGAYSVMATPIP